MTTKLEDAIASLEAAVRLNSAVLAQHYRAIQTREAEKTADDWRGYHAIVFANDTYQVLGRNPKRESLSVKNTGPSVALVSGIYFQGAEMAARYASGMLGSMLNIYALDVGEAITLPAHGCVYAYSVSFPTNQQAVLKIIETMFLTGRTSKHHADREGSMGLVDRGIADLDADKHGHTLV